MNRQNNQFNKKLAQIVERYGNLLPEGEKVKYWAFIEILEKRMLVSNPIVKQDIKFLQIHFDLIWKRQNNSVSLTKIM